MTQVCRPAKCIEAIRVALLDSCTFDPICGPLKGYAMGCIIEPEWSPEIEEGEESIVKDNCGNICLRDDRCDQIKRWNLAFKIKNPDPEFLALVSGDNLVVNDGNSVGVQHIAQGCSPYVFVELFEKTDDCQTGLPVYFRHIFPAVRLKWTGNEREGIFRILQIEGKSKDRLLSAVGTGPFDDIPAYATTAPAGTRSDYFWFEDTTVPTVACGAIEVPCPEPPGFLVLSQEFPDLDARAVWAVEEDGSSSVILTTLPEIGTNEVVPTVLGRSQDKSIFAILAMTGGASFTGDQFGDAWFVYDDSGVFVATGTGGGDQMQFAAYPAISPDNLNVAYRYDNTGGSGSIDKATLADVDTTIQPSNAGDDEDYRTVAWSPDGTMVAYFVETNSGGDYLVRVRTAAGVFVSESTVLLDAPYETVDSTSWPIMCDADSSFLHFFDNNDNFYKQDALTGVYTTFNHPTTPFAWDLSPDGTTVVYLAAITGTTAAIFTLDIASTVFTQRTTAFDLNGNSGMSISYSSDGTKAASLYQNGTGTRNNSIVIADLTVAVPTAPITHDLV